MALGDLPSVHVQFPDEAHEALRLYVDRTTVGVDDLAAGMAALAQLADFVFMQLDLSIADRKDIRAIALLARDIATATRDNLAAEVTRATQAEAALSARIAALEARTLRGTTGTATISSLIAGTTNVTVTLKAPMASADYIALPVIDATSGINLTSVTATVTAKTATTVTVRVANSGLGLAQTVNLTVIAVQIA